MMTHLLVGDRVEEVEHLSRQVFQDVESGEHGDGIEHYHDNAGGDGAFNDDIKESLPGESFVDEKSGWEHSRELPVRKLPWWS